MFPSCDQEVWHDCTAPSELLSLQLPLRIRIGDAQAFDLGPDPQVTMVIRDPSLLTEITHPSLDALGKAYVEKRLDIEGPISQVIGIGDALSEALGEPDGGAPVRESHDKDTDAEAIHYHYDLSNDFYQLWLDPEMVYSCAYFETGKEDLATAQLAKPPSPVPQAAFAAGREAARCRLRLGRAGAPGRSRVRRRGHRHHIEQGAAGARPGAGQGRRPGGPGHPQAAGLPRPAARWPLDKVVSVGMFEHVGHANLGLYFQQLYGCGASRRPGDEPRHHLALHRRPPGWQGPATSSIATCFPGELPHHLSLAVARMSEAGLEVVDVESLRLHYARTLDFWSANLEARLKEAARLVPEETLRIWRLYLARMRLRLQARLDQPAPDPRHSPPTRMAPRAALVAARPVRL